jgi:hypothetical protein
MIKLAYLVLFVFFSVLLATGMLFALVTTVVPERAFIAFVLLGVGTVGAGATAWFYWRWYGRQPAVLGARATDLAEHTDGEVSLAQVMAAYHVPASVAQAAMDQLVEKGQCHAETLEGQLRYIFPGLKERKMVRKCVYCGSTFPVRDPLQKCPNCGGNLELVEKTS